MSRGTSSVAIAMALALAGGPARGAGAQVEGRTKLTVEVRSYNLKAGGRPEFHRLATEQAVPMLRRWKIDVVAYGPSPQDETSYYLIRAFANREERQRSEDAFYGSDEWKTGPREAVLALIESYTTVLLELDEATVLGLRRP